VLTAEHSLGKALPLLIVEGVPRRARHDVARMRWRPPENEFNGIGGMPILRQDYAGTRHLSDWRAGVPMQEIYASIALGGAVIALAATYSLWVLRRRK
jgi:hypothetical protein